MAPFSDSPFAALTIVDAPAILTNASSVLCMGTANLLARVVDRTRVVSAELAHIAPNADTIVTFRRQLEELSVRWNLVLRRRGVAAIGIESLKLPSLCECVGPGSGD